MVYSMSVLNFFKLFVTDGRAKHSTEALDTFRKVPHTVLQNGWEIPNFLLNKLRRYKKVENCRVEIYEPTLDSDVAIEFFHSGENSRGSLTLLFGILAPGRA